MRCRDVKKLIRVSKLLEAENSDLRNRLESMKSLSERRIPFNMLDIIIRPSRREHSIGYEMVEVDLHVNGSDKIHNTVALSTLDMLREHEEEFIKGIGELMAKELMAYGKEKIHAHD